MADDTSIIIQKSMEVSGIYTMQQRLFHKKEKSPETAKSANNKGNQKRCRELFRRQWMSEIIHLFLFWVFHGTVDTRSVFEASFAGGT